MPERAWTTSKSCGPCKGMASLSSITKDLRPEELQLLVSLMIALVFWKASRLLRAVILKRFKAQGFGSTSDQRTDRFTRPLLFHGISNSHAIQGHAILNRHFSDIPPESLAVASFRSFDRSVTGQCVSDPDGNHSLRRRIGSSKKCHEIEAAMAAKGICPPNPTKFPSTRLAPQKRTK